MTTPPNVLLRSEETDGVVSVLAFAPRNVPHTYANLSGRPARALGPPLESAHQTRRTE